MRTIKTLLVIILFVYSPCGHSQADPGGEPKQQGEIQGQVLDASDGSPLVGATVTMVDRFGGTFADTNGSFRLTNLPVGDYALKFSHVGYEPELIRMIAVTAGESIEVTARLDERIMMLKGITVTPGRFQIMGGEPSAQQSLTQSEMETVPQLGDDFFRAVKRLPGMSGNDFSTRFTVRGGEYDEVLVTLDGLEIHEPFHLKDIDGGAISVVDVAAVDGIDLMTGGFPAKFGDKMSGVFDIKSRQIPPDRKRLLFGLSIMNLRFLSEGTYADNRGTWLVAARRGYIDLVLKLAGADDEIKPKYYDLFGQTRYQLNHKHVLSGTFLHAGDNVRVVGEDEDAGDTLQTSYGNTYAWLTLWSEIHPKITVRTIASLGRVKHDRRGQEYNRLAQGVKQAGSDEESFSFIGLKSDWDYEVSDWYFMRLGFDSRWVDVDYNYWNNIYNYEYVTTPDSAYISLDHIDTTAAKLSPSGNKLGLYLSNRIRPLKPLTLELGLRYDQASYTGDELYSPRVNAVYDVGPRTKVRLGWGHFYQMERADEIMVGDGETEFHPAERAEHWVAGLQQDFDNGLHLRLEGYYKKYSDLRPDYRNSFDDIEAFPEVEWDRTVVHRERGMSRGLEVYLKKDTGGKFSWWASYAYAKCEDSVSVIDFPPEETSIVYNTRLPMPNDQRHTLYFDCNYRPNHNWQLNVAFQYHSGWPYTGVHLVTGEQTYINADDQWSSRHKSYKRLDFRFNRYFGVGSGRITAFVELLNVLNSKNVRSYSYHIRQGSRGFYLDATPEYWFQRMPSFGVAYEISM